MIEGTPLGKLHLIPIPPVSEATKIGINGFGRIGRMVFQVRRYFVVSKPSKIEVMVKYGAHGDVIFCWFNGD